ncbi:MAG TPA: hypothetical protein VNZ27_06730 [Rhodanobacter sp.]|jgi:orotidine-5'-phosphate decarboxylase|nr:hypothetical protein [Rhodanobacter sp.]
MVRKGYISNDSGLLISSSRATLHADNVDDFAEAARDSTQELRDTINRYRHG